MARCRSSLARSASSLRSNPVNRSDSVRRVVLNMTGSNLMPAVIVARIAVSMKCTVLKKCWCPVQSDLTFPQSLTDKYRPDSIGSFAGLEKPKAVLQAFTQKPFPSAWLFVGPSGTGKTTMGLALAPAIPAELHHIASQDCTLETVERIRMTCQYVPISGTKMHLVLVDEADRMSYPAQIAFLSKLDATDFPPNTVFVFTCNSVETLEKRFLSRCRVLEFHKADSGDLTALLASVWS